MRAEKSQKQTLYMQVPDHPPINEDTLPKRNKVIMDTSDGFGEPVTSVKVCRAMEKKEIYAAYIQEVKSACNFATNRLTYEGEWNRTFLNGSTSIHRERRDDQIGYCRLQNQGGESHAFWHL
ncbi:hypothetical protein CW304_10700 [Bacillus sp. UFRGS-B20]|nr:hypothetical protein CW304_10700 [Bacillus sp. UFRGS-B20]